MASGPSGSSSMCGTCRISPGIEIGVIEELRARHARPENLKAIARLADAVEFAALHGIEQAGGDAGNGQRLPAVA
mgnify:CR=1 FL=1